MGLGYLSWDLDVTQVGLGYLGGTWLLRTWILKWDLLIGLKVELSTVLKDLSNALKLKEPYC